MIITISAEDSRSIRALEIAATADKWIRCTAREGRSLLGIPSQCREGAYYLVDVNNGVCDCQDFRRNGLTSVRVGVTALHGACKHLRAALLHQELVKAAQNTRPKRRGLHIVEAVRRFDNDRPLTREAHPELARILGKPRVLTTTRED